MIREIRFVYFRHALSDDGRIFADSMFRIKSDAENAQNARKDAVEWAGNAGENLKVSGGGQNKWEMHPDFIVDAINIKELDNESVFEVEMHGIPKTEGWMLLPGSVRTEENGVILRKMEYSFCGTEIPSGPHAGEITVDSDGIRMVCTSSRIIDSGGLCKKLEVSFKSIRNFTGENEENTFMLLKKENFFKDNVLFCKGCFYWTPEVYSNKCAELKFWDLNYPPLWAGENFVLEKMESDSDGCSGYYVELIARKIENKLVKTEFIENSENKNASAVYCINKNDADSFDGLIGTVPVFAGDDYIITQVCRREINPVQFEITVYASECGSQTQIGEMLNSQTDNGQNFREAVFFVPFSEVEDFRSGAFVGASAEWAGDNFYVDSCIEKENKSGIVFEIKAAEIYTRMLSLTRTEKFSGYNIDGTPVRKVVYNSVWQVHADDLGNFIDHSGLNAEWSNDDAVITEIIPVKKSDIEYQVKMEAQRRTNPELHTYYNCENYESLSSREDLDCELIDFRFSPKDCGYYMHGDGLFDYIPGWIPASECPLVTVEPLPRRFINAIVKILRISETTYRKGGMHKVIDDIIKWCDTRVYNGRVGNYNGSFLKNDIYSKEIYDNHGVQWTRITKVYDLAPVDTQWNVYYFRQFDL